MGYKLQDGLIGYPPIEALMSAVNFAAGGQGPSPGEIVTAVDKVWGGAEFIFARANGSIRSYGLCVLTPVWDGTNKVYTWNATECPNTANLGRALGVGPGLAMVSGQYGWFMLSGNTPINGTASVAADTTVGITAAGQIGANSAGKQLLNARGVTAATNTVVKAATGLSGDFILNVADTDGWFVGGYLSGTGVGAAAIIAEIGPMGKWVRGTVADSPGVASNVTQTANNATIFYNIVNLNRAFAQGAIT